jgi:hypothetical protein
MSPRCQCEFEPSEAPSDDPGALTRIVTGTSYSPVEPTGGRQDGTGPARCRRRVKRTNAAVHLEECKD